MQMPRDLIGKAIAVLGPVAPAELGRVMMHEHLHLDIYEADWTSDVMIQREKRASPQRLEYLLKEAVPLLKKCRTEHGMGAYCDVTMPPWRGWPNLYTEVSRASGVHIVLATGFYREIELGAYWAKTRDRQIWPFVRESSIEQLAEMCVREIVEGVNGTDVRAGCIKLGTSLPPMTPDEMKTFRAGARAQRATGVHITTHATLLGAETSQLTVLDEEGVDLRRVVIGHTAWHIGDKSYRRTVLEWMKRGANFMPTNLDVTKPENWRPMVESFREIFQAGHGDKLVLSLDGGFGSIGGPFKPVTYLPPSTWLYLFTDTLPVLRSLGMSADEEDAMMRANPQRILPVQAT